LGHRDAFLPWETLAPLNFKIKVLQNASQASERVYNAKFLGVACHSKYLRMHQKMCSHRYLRMHHSIYNANVLVDMSLNPRNAVCVKLGTQKFTLCRPHKTFFNLALPPPPSPPPRRRPGGR